MSENELARRIEIDEGNIEDNSALITARVIVENAFREMCDNLGEWGMIIDPTKPELLPHEMKQLAIEARWDAKPNIPG